MNPGRAAVASAACACHPYRVRPDRAFCLCHPLDDAADLDASTVGGNVETQYGGHLSLAFAGQWQREAGADSECQSIEKNDLFGRDANEAAYDLGYSPSRHNPFADYLRKFAMHIAKPEVVLVDDDMLEETGALEDFPDYWVCQEDIERTAGESGSDAAAALELGYVRLRDIPDELWAQDAARFRFWTWRREDSAQAQNGA